VYTKSPQTVNTARFNVERESRMPASRASRLRRPAWPARLQRARFPGFLHLPYVGMGRSYPRSRFSIVFYTWRNGLSTKQGKHSLTVTVNTSDPAHGYQSSYPPATSASRGFDQPAWHHRTGHGFASFLLGLAGTPRRATSSRRRISARTSVTFRSGINTRPPRA